MRPVPTLARGLFVTRFIQNYLGANLAPECESATRIVIRARVRILINWCLKYRREIDKRNDTDAPPKDTYPISHCECNYLPRCQIDQKPISPFTHGKKVALNQHWRAIECQHSNRAGLPIFSVRSNGIIFNWTWTLLIKRWITPTTQPCRVGSIQSHYWLNVIFLCAPFARTTNAAAFTRLILRTRVRMH